MTNAKTSRRALVSSVIALMLCFAMLVGTTFAWFTDEVVTGMNTINAGNLDIELLAGDAEVDSATKLFDDVELWEPGVVVYENLKVANVGTLALKYQMTLNFGNENDLNGNKLSDVLKVAVIDAVAEGATRAQVLAAAKAAVGEDQGMGTLSNFYLTGELEAGESTNEQAIVIFWEPNANDVDNLYNANNGQETSDGLPLHIDFGINLQATQLMSEEDSFGNDYDGAASILPKATVNNLGAQTVTATAGIGGTASDYDLPFSMQFLPNETAEEAAASEYANWHADYVVKASKDVPADSIALLGYYDAWCQYNDDNWVAMINENTAIEANTEIRLVELLGVTVSYEEICLFGNDGIGFLCGAVDLTGENAGTTITVELRMYEAPSTGTSSTVESETGNYEVIGTYSYTFPAAQDSTDLVSKESLSGVEVTMLEGGTKTLSFDAYTFDSDLFIERYPAGTYGDWECDYYVSTDGPVAAGLYLVGNYGSYDWIGFEAPVSDAAYESTPLLGSVTSNPWTYQDVLDNVGTFICGLTDDGGNNSGTTVTVELRLTKGVTNITVTSIDVTL